MIVVVRRGNCPGNDDFRFAFGIESRVVTVAASGLDRV